MCIIKVCELFSGFHLSGTVAEPGNPLYSADVDKTYQVSISFDR